MPMTGLEIAPILLSVLANRTVPTKSDVRGKLDEVSRNTKISDEFGQLAAEFNRSLVDRIESRAKDLDHLELQSLAFHWDIIAEQIDFTEIVFESEEEAVTWLIEEVNEAEDVNLDKEASEELQKLLSEEFRNVVDDFRDRVIQNEELSQQLQAKFQADVLDRLATIREEFDQLAYRRPYTLYSFPEDRERVISTLLPENTVEFVDRQEVPKNPDPGRYVVVGPSGAGKTRILAAFINRLPENSVNHILLPDERMLDPADVRGITREEFAGDVLLVWEDIHRIDEGGESLVLESAIHELSHALDSDGHTLYALLEARSGQLHNVPGNLPAAFDDEQSFWSDFEELRVENVDPDFIHDLAVRMADKYDVSTTDGVLEALIDQTASRSAPIYIDAVLGTAGDELTISDMEDLPDNVEDLWKIQYESLQSDSRDELYVLASMKLLYDLNLPYYSKLVRTIYLELLSGDRGRFRRSVEQLKEKRQWIDIRGEDLVSRQTQYYIHDVQLEAIQVRARDDASELSGVLLSEEESLPTYTRPIAHLNAGAAFSKWGHISLAIDQWKAALDLDPTFPEVHFNYGLLLAKHQGNPTEAETHLRKAIEYDPEFLEAYYSYALLLQQSLGRPKAAADYYRRALELDSEFVEALYNLGLVLHRDLDRPEEAEEYYRKTLKENSDHAPAHNNYGVLLKEDLNRPTEAKQHFERSLSIDPSHTLAHLNYANLLNDELSESQEAKQHFESALQLEPQNADIHYEYGTFLKKELNQEKAGEKHLSIARSINPEEYKSANIEIEKYPQNLSVETKKQSVSSRPVAINLGADIPRNTAVEATVKQDVTGDGRPDHEQVIHLMNGESKYRLDEFDPTGGDVWTEIKFRSKDGQDTALFDLPSYELYVVDNSPDENSS
ncbi:tetratricopeptide repeat protein [Halobacterium salinarum]|nr:tetratricopeptide repeat protein [Halobacterium salinarum]MDL0138778.1 tetratricopeptide repeat protein [Halobacterium salinarum]QCC46110.1 tetratricopeptide repeat protein [Halobacterium salinarum]QCC46188.1 tetratricopeptide repeat protein [Halobacterium salinarum]